MLTGHIQRIVFAFCAIALLALPAVVAAQPSTFIIPFDRTGDPGTEIQLQPDPLDPTTMVEVPVDFGAFVNPCTIENVDVTGSSTISSVQTVDNKGNVKVSVSVRTKGTGRGWTGANYLNAIFSGATYAFDDNQQFSFRLPAVGQEFSSDFSNKLALRGAGSIDNWTISAHFRIRVTTTGEVQVLMLKTSGDVCKG